MCTFIKKIAFLYSDEDIISSYFDTPYSEIELIDILDNMIMEFTYLALDHKHETLFVLSTVSCVLCHVIFRFPYFRLNSRTCLRLCFILPYVVLVHVFISLSSQLHIVRRIIYYRD